ncbi:NUDIX domain-containing protein [Allohahella marinimesophila]|uniref:ADP-ribose pyrophosphatase n=1 Tax=Allohahella marinimesophila TaxID=1054972 RepID=A0ABP7PJI8_9GAMM
MSADGFDYEDVQILDNDLSYDGFFKIRSLRLRHRLFADGIMDSVEVDTVDRSVEGAWSGVIRRECFVRDQVAVVLPYHAESDSVVLNEEFRIGACLQSGASAELVGSPWLLEIVAGICEKGEDPEASARREANEEAGLKIGRLVPVHQYLPSPGGSNEFVNLYCGLLDEKPEPGVFGMGSEAENIRTRVVSRKEAMTLLADGHIRNAATIIALQWLTLNLSQFKGT